MKAIYVIEYANKQITCINTDYVKYTNLNTSEIIFLHYLIPLQLDKGVNEWIILKLDDLSMQLNCPKSSVNNWLKKLRECNLLIQESFRSSLWKINSDLIEVICK